MEASIFATCVLVELSQWKKFCIQGVDSWNQKWKWKDQQVFSHNGRSTWHSKCLPLYTLPVLLFDLSVVCQLKVKSVYGNVN